MNKNTAGLNEPIWDSRNSDEPPRMSDKCPHSWTTPPECPSCMAIELESLRQENSRLREALGEIVERYRIALPAPALVDDMQRIARQALNPPKRS